MEKSEQQRHGFHGLLKASKQSREQVIDDLLVLAAQARQVGAFERLALAPAVVAPRNEPDR
jgi:hypothetical protein